MRDFRRGRGPAAGQRQDRRDDGGGARHRLGDDKAAGAHANQQRRGAVALGQPHQIGAGRIERGLSQGSRRRDGTVRGRRAVAVTSVGVTRTS